MPDPPSSLKQQPPRGSGNRVTFRLYLATLLLTGAVFCLLGWQVYHSYQVTKQTVGTELRLKELAGTIVYLDEVLTMSARMAALTGELRWEERYRFFERKLDTAIKEVRRLSPKVDSEAASQTDTANIRLIEMENRAFQLVRQGRQAQAQAILSSEGYERQKRIYAQGMDRFTALLNSRAEATLSNERDKAFFAAAVLVGLLPVLFLTWVVVLWNLRRWQWAFEDSSRLVRQHAQSLETANQTLEQDILQRRGAEEALRKSEERFQLIAHATNDAIWDWDLLTNRVWWNEGVQALFGYSADQIGKDASWWMEHIHPEDRERVVSGISGAIEAGQQFWSDEYRYLREDSSYAQVLDRGYVIRDNGKPVRMIGAMLDVTVRKQAQEQLLHNAFYDALTDLPNRALFMDRLGQLVERSKRRKDYLFAALLLDFDRFKIVNESLGHMVGDQLLIAIARRLETCLRPGDTFARLGGDEFVILLEDVKEANGATRVADSIQKELTVPFNLSGQEVFIDVSIGIALSATGYGRPEDLLRDAETAMYRAKAHGKGRYEMFDSDMHARAVAFLRLETELRRAVERQELFLHYQPMVSLKTGQITGCEALVRWRHPQRGVVSPADFIPVAEETGLIMLIGDWVLREACAQNKAWQQAGLPPLCVTVNISARQFRGKGFCPSIAQVLRETGLAAQHLRLELTESSVMEDIDQTLSMLWEMKGLGVELSMDDFGTGYSSLGYLSRFPFDVLKMDRSFVRNITTNPHDARIAVVVIALAHSLKLKVVAEGVEEEKQLAFLRSQWCDEVQGYLFSPAVSPEAFSEMVQQGRNLAAG